MSVKYIKHFPVSDFNYIWNRLFESRRPSIWQGTVFIGKVPLYIECCIDFIADKIEKYFVKTMPGVYVDGAKKLYLLDKTLNNLLGNDINETNVCWLGENIYTNPDAIIYCDGVFIRNGNNFIFANDTASQYAKCRIDSNHLFMLIFNYLFNPLENMVLHASVVAYNDYGILITGVSGAGKSTLAGYCLSMGMDFVGDDRIALCKDRDILYANPIYKSLSLNAPIANIKYSDIIHQSTGCKDMFILDESQIANNVKICAVLEPTRDGYSAPKIIPCKKSPIITRMCMDFCAHSSLVNSTNPMQSYNDIFNLLKNADFYNIKLSKSIYDNAMIIFNLAKSGGKNV